MTDRRAGELDRPKRTSKDGGAGGGGNGRKLTDVWSIRCRGTGSLYFIQSRRPNNYLGRAPSLWPRVQHIFLFLPHFVCSLPRCFSPTFSFHCWLYRFAFLLFFFCLRVARVNTSKNGQEKLRRSGNAYLYRISCSSSKTVGSKWEGKEEKERESV